MPALERLISILKEMSSVLLAYSGGVDSTLLLKAVQLSGIKAIAVTSGSESIPTDDMENAVRLSKELNIQHMVIKTDEFGNEEFLRNSSDRCFHCKDELFGRLIKIAKSEGYGYVIDGSNMDDTKDHRPGMLAAKKHKVSSPLIDAGITKSMVRAISKELALDTWDRPSSPCLSSRVPYGTRITSEALNKIRLSETYLRSLGFKEFRVRHHGDTARIELNSEDIILVISNGTRDKIVREFKQIGYRFVSLDLEGFISGKMNNGLFNTVR